MKDQDDNFEQNFDNQERLNEDLSLEEMDKHWEEAKKEL